jgi:N12 class adenine-specific DNA methylase
VKFTGWGGLKEMFSTRKGDQRFLEERKELQSLLSEDELKSASRSVRNSHYTSPMVVGAMWRALERFGIGQDPSALNILEPAAGVGHFFGLMPEAIAHRSRLFGAELDSLTGRIARQLYPEALIRVQGFETIPLAEGTVDVAVSNVPFGGYGVTFKPWPRAKQFLTKPIHDFFFARSLDALRPGGVLAFITSDGTLDKGSRRTREYLASQADLIGAIRLPVDAFKANAGADVTTDIIFLRKREPGAKPAHAAPWVETVTLTDPNGKTYQVNEYYAAHPEMMLGEMVVGDNRYGPGEEVHLESRGRFTEEALEAVVDRLPEGAYQARAVEVQDPPAPFQKITAPDDMAEGGYVKVDGVVMQKVGDQLVDPMLGAGKNADIVGRMIDIRDALRETLRTQQEDLPAKQQDAARKELNLVYDAFVAKYGPVNETTWYEHKRTDPKTGEQIVTPYSRQLNLAPFLADPDADLVAALEDWNEETRTASKTAIFTHRVIQRQAEPAQVDNAPDALPIVLAELGRVDLDAIAERAGITTEEARTQLQGLAFRDPATGAWETADAYLSGNVREKLEFARAIAQEDPSYQENVEALEKVQPEDIDPADIYASLGAPWVETTDYQAFAAELVGGEIKLRWHRGKKEWDVEVVKGGRSVAVSQEWGTEKAPFYRLLQGALNQQSPNITMPDPSDPAGKRRIKDGPATADALAKQQEIAERFQEWLWQDGERAMRLHRTYNDRYNNLRTRQFDGRHLSLPGAAGVIKGRPFALRDWQKAGIWRILQSPNTLLAHVVGAGKTFTMVGAAMELRRLGLAKKPMFAVPNHMLRQFSNEFYEMYPNARLLVANEHAFDGRRRRRFTAKAATGDWDAIIMTHSSFEMVGMSRGARAEFINEELAELRAAMEEAKAEKGSDNRNYITELENAQERLEMRLDDLLADDKKDSLLSFEEIGVDALFVDEAHLFKNLFTRSKIKGMAQAGSERAMDLYMKTRFLNKTRGRIVLATGTPISNSMAELHVTQRYLQPQLLQERGIEQFDAWAAQFGIVKQEAELTATGKFEVKERFSEFVNVPELIDMWHQVTDVLLAGDGKEPRTIALPRPEMMDGKPEAFVAPTPEGMVELAQEFEERMKAIKKREVTPEEDNPLKIATEARHAALDMRLIDVAAVRSDERKTAVAAKRIAGLYQEHAGLKGTQLVFLDLSTPSAAGRASVMGGIDNFSAYFDLRDELMRQGVPAEQIAFMQDAAGSDKKKQALLAKVKAGEVRILVGSTETMGAGTNVQDRLVALHHLDVPWKPAELEQREGRILRQGNRLYDDGAIPGVHVIRYVTEGSYDALMWQTVERKAKFIGQVMKGDKSVRRMEDLDAVVLDAAQMKAFSTGNPLHAEAATVDAKVTTLERAKKSHISRQGMNRQELGQLPVQIRVAEKDMDAIRSDIARVIDTKGDLFRVRIGKTDYTSRVDAGERLKKIITQHHLAWVEGGRKPTEKQIGEFAGFDLWITEQMEVSGKEGIYLELRGEGVRFAKVGVESTAASVIASLEHVPRSLEKSAEMLQASIDRLLARQEDLKKLTDVPFPKQDELDKVKARQKEIQEALNPPDPEVEAEALAEAPAPKELPERTVDRLRQQLMATGTARKDAEALSGNELIAAALDRGILDEASASELQSILSSEEGFLRIRREAKATGEPTVLVEKLPPQAGWITKYLMPTQVVWQRMLRSKRADVRSIGERIRTIVTAGQDAHRKMSQLIDRGLSTLERAQEGLSRKERTVLVEALDKIERTEDLPTNVSQGVRDAFDSLRKYFRQTWRELGLNDRVMLSNSSREILDAALALWPEGSTPDFENVPINRKNIEDAARRDGRTHPMPDTREGWENLVAGLKADRRRVQRPVFMDSPDLQRIWGMIRGEGGILAYFPHVFSGDWVVRHGAHTKRFIDRNDAVQYARKLIEDGVAVETLLVSREGFTGDGALYTSRKQYEALVGRLSKELEAENAEVRAALRETGRIKGRPRRRWFAHGQKREVNLQTFERDLETAVKVYTYRFAKKVSFDPFRKQALEVAESLPHDGGWREWAESYISDVQGVPQDWVQNVNNSITAAFDKVGLEAKPFQVQRWVSKWQQAMGLWHLGLSPITAMVNLTQTAINTVPAFEEGGYRKVMAAAAQLGKGEDATLAILHEAGIDLAQTKYMGGEYLPRSWRSSGMLNNIIMYLFNRSEYVNRGVAVLAKYNEAIEGGASHKAALRAGIEFGNKTQFDYGITGSGRVQRNPFGRAALQFKTFPINQVWFTEDIARWGNTRQRAAFTAHMMAFGGLWVLAAATPLAAANWMLGLTGIFEDEDGEKVTPWEAMIAAAERAGLNPMLPIIKYGLVSLFGIAVSERVGSMGFSPRELSTIPGGKVQDLARALNANDPEQRKAAYRRLMPSQVARIIRMIEAAQANEIRDGFGNRVKTDPSVTDLVGLGLGVQTVEAAERSAQIRKERKIITRYRDRREKYLGEAAQAIRARDNVRLREVLTEAREKGIRITADQARAQIRRRDMDDERRRDRRAPRDTRRIIRRSREPSQAP